MYGAFRFGNVALVFGAATSSETERNTIESVATVTFTASLAAPVGVLMWGFLINRLSVEAAIVVGAAMTVVVAAATIWREDQNP